ncbi:tRNA dihydrouridine synthase DusB [Candidatus Woesearchaeota archaeon CG10_big_fil_rev_8_21_14_0_10_36_11]|nr:MAG: tRNA dihydrouridine synthase DusB [Candidatus Woesearchaeota archaeon CG10_big_fil_rev_8_21_14_0_10_36_11]
MALPIFNSRVFFAPMAGVSDPALRLICKELGAGLVVTPFTNIHAIVARKEIDKEIKKFIEFSPKEKPIAVQLFGSDIEQLTRAVHIVEKHFDIIDYNMGCPSPTVTEQMACSALLQEPELTRKIFRAMVNATTKPVTLKMRSGIDKPDCFKLIARIAEEEGITMVTFHPRTVKQGYAGNANWSLIKELKEQVSIPVVGNGDIRTPEDAQRMFDETGCDYVMVGRAAAQNPFLFTQMNEFLETGTYKETSCRERITMFFKYLKYAEEYPTIKLSNIRMHAMNFSKGCKGSKRLRGKLLTVQSVEDIKKLFNEFYDSLE